MNPNLPIIVGLTGTHGAGKGEVVKFLKPAGFEHFSAREAVLWPEVDARSLPRNRESLHLVANDLRRQHGPEHVAFQLFRHAEAHGDDAVIESIYTVGEIKKIRDAAHGQFFLIAIDADVQIRYDRIHGRQSETDRINFETFKAEQEREMYNPDPTKHNLRACQGLADVLVVNNGTLAVLYRQLRRAMPWINEIVD